MLDNKKKSILISILIAISIMSTLAFSYAFRKMQNDENISSISASSSILSLIYSECEDNSDETCGTINKDLKVGDSFSKRFTIENTGSTDVTVPLYFTSLENSFKNDELVYSIEDISTGQIISTGPVPYSPDTSINVRINPDITIKVEEKREFQLTVTFIAVNDDQNYNLDASYMLRLGLLSE